MTEKTNPHNQEPPHEFTQRFIDAVSSVEAYNNKNTGLGFAVSGMVRFLIPEHVADQPKVSPKDQADMEKELVSLLQTDELREMGITLFDSSESTGELVEFGEDGGNAEATKYPSKLIMLITDGELFGDSLNKLNPNAEQKSQVSSGVNSILANTVGLVEIASNIRGEVDAGHEPPQTHLEGFIDDQLNMFMELAPRLVEKGLGGGEAFKLLAEYSARNSAGTLDDYLEAKGKGWLSERGFGPDKWAMDASPEYLNKRWNEVFNHLKDLRDRDEPSPYFSELFNKVRLDFDTSNNWLEGNTDDENRKQYIGTYIEPLKVEMAELSKVWAEEFPLENSFYLSKATES